MAGGKGLNAYTTIPPVMSTEQARFEMDRDEFEAFVSAKIARREMERD